MVRMDVDDAERPVRCNTAFGRRLRLASRPQCAAHAVVRYAKETALAI